MIIVDSSVWVDYFAAVVNAHTDWLDRELGRQPVGLTDLILCEVLQGIGDDRQFFTVRRELSSLHLFHSGGAGLAIAAARNYRSLRKQGSTVRKTIDCLIATLCIEAQFGLLHRDRDFDPFEVHLGLRVIHP